MADGGSVTKPQCGGGADGAVGAGAGVTGGGKKCAIFNTPSSFINMTLKMRLNHIRARTSYDS